MDTLYYDCAGQVLIGLWPDNLKKNIIYLDLLLLLLFFTELSLLRKFFSFPL